MKQKEVLHPIWQGAGVPAYPPIPTPGTQT